MSDIKKRLYDYLHSRQAAGFGDLTLFNELYEHISEQSEEIQMLSDELTKWRKGLNSISYDTKDAEIQRLESEIKELRAERDAKQWYPYQDEPPKDTGA